MLDNTFKHEIGDRELLQRQVGLDHDNFFAPFLGVVLIETIYSYPVGSAPPAKTSSTPALAAFARALMSVVANPVVWSLVSLPHDPCSGVCRNGAIRDDELFCSAKGSAEANQARIGAVDW